MRDTNPKDEQPHLDDETLGAYFDGELEPEARARAQEHLARCQHCEARLALLSELADELGELPELPLERDLAPGVLAAIVQRQAPDKAGAQKRGPGERWRPGRGLLLIFAAQLVGAALLLGLAWPPGPAGAQSALAERLGALRLPGLESLWSPGGTSSELLSAAEATLAILRLPEGTQLDAGLNPLNQLPPLPPLGTATIVLLVSALLWAAGSVALLRPIIRRDASSLARRSSHE